MHNQPGFARTVITHNAAVASANGTTVDLSNPATGHYPTVSVQAEGISGDTIYFEGSNNNADWYAVELKSLGASGTVATSMTADGIWWGFVPALVHFRTRLVRSSGTVTVTVCAAS